MVSRSRYRVFSVTMEDGEVRYQVADGLTDGDADECTAGEVLAELHRSWTRRETAPWVPLAGVVVVYLVFVGALAMRASTLLLVAASLVSVACVAGVYALARRADARTGSARVTYTLDEPAAERFGRLQNGLRRLAACSFVWHVPPEGRTTDTRRKLGAHHFLRRYRIRPALARPARLRSNLRVPTLYGERRKFFFFPDRVLVYEESAVTAIPYDVLGMHAIATLCVEDEHVPTDAPVVDTTWLHVLPDGSPDPSFVDNRRYPIVLYTEVEFAGPGGVRELFLCSQPDGADAFVAAVSGVISEGDRSRDSSENGGDANHEDVPSAETDADVLYDDALCAIVRAGGATVERVAGDLGIEYSAAAMLLGRMEIDGYVGPAYRNKPRVVNRAAVRYVELVFGPDSNGDAANRERRRDARARHRAEAHAKPVSRAPHEVLGIDASASRAEIAEAFRDMAMMYHPDKVASLAPEFRDLAERRMKEISAAYTELMKSR